MPRADRGGRSLPGSWRDLGIAGKLLAAFGSLLALCVLLALTGLLLLRLIHRHLESNIVTSLEIQRLILEMDAGLERARQLEKDFFLRWPAAGFEAAREASVQRFAAQIDGVVAASSRVREMVAAAGADAGWTQQMVGLNFFLSAADRYGQTFREAVDLVAELGAEGQGLQPRLAALAAGIWEHLEAAGDPRLLLLFWEMESHEKEYLLTRQRPHMQTAFNLASRLRQDLGAGPGAGPGPRRAALDILSEHLAVAEKILDTDVEIRSRLAEFDLQAGAVDPLARQFVEMGKREVNKSREAIARLTRLGSLLLVAAVAVAVVLAGIIAWLLNAGITRNVRRLTRAAQELRRGNLEARAEVPGQDEIGQLAGAFNAMAENIRQRTRELTDKARELEHANRRLTELDAMKSEFVSSVSHELRTPLTSILGFAKILDRDFARHFLPLAAGNPHLEGKGEVIHSNLLIIGQEGQRLTRLINQVLDLNKIESGKVEWCDVEVAPAWLVERAVNAVRGQFAELPGVRLVAEACAGLPAVRVDSDRLVQVLVNLLHNAAKFTSQGSVAVKAAARKREVWFEVADTGAGIPSEALPTLFDKFQQAGRSGAEPGPAQGTGLGLAICKQIVEHYGGKIQVDSRPGQGSAFSFALPAAGAGAG